MFQNVLIILILFILLQSNNKTIYIMNKKQVKAILKTLDSTDQLILTYMKEGLDQLEISEKFKELNFKPHSLSIIEKRLRAIRLKFGAKTNFQLAFIISIV